MSLSPRSLRARVGGAFAVGGVALLVAACGSSGASNAAPSTGTDAASVSAAGAAAISTSSSGGHLHLVGPNGHAVYLWKGDTGTTSHCTGACAKAWPPVLTKGSAKAGKGVKASMLGTTKRSGDALQVTYHGHPLYYFIGDKAAGTTSGQGDDAFGAKWFVVSPAGSAITTSAAPAPAPTSTTSSATSTTSSSGGAAGGGWG